MSKCFIVVSYLSVAGDPSVLPTMMGESSVHSTRPDVSAVAWTQGLSANTQDPVRCNAARQHRLDGPDPCSLRRRPPGGARRDRRPPTPRVAQRPRRRTPDSQARRPRMREPWSCPF